MSNDATNDTSGCPNSPGNPGNSDNPTMADKSAKPKAPMMRITGGFGTHEDMAQYVDTPTDELPSFVTRYDVPMPIAGPTTAATAPPPLAEPPTPAAATFAREVLEGTPLPPPTEPQHPYTTVAEAAAAEPEYAPRDKPPRRYEPEPRAYQTVAEAAATAEAQADAAQIEQAPRVELDYEGAPTLEYEDPNTVSHWPFELADIGYIGNTPLGLPLIDTGAHAQNRAFPMTSMAPGLLMPGGLRLPPWPPPPTPPIPEGIIERSAWAKYYRWRQGLAEFVSWFFDDIVGLPSLPMTEDGRILPPPRDEDDCALPPLRAMWSLDEAQRRRRDLRILRVMLLAGGYDRLQAGPDEPFEFWTYPIRGRRWRVVIKIQERTGTQDLLLEATGRNVIAIAVAQDGDEDGLRPVDGGNATCVVDGIESVAISLGGDGAHYETGVYRGPDASGLPKGGRATAEARKACCTAIAVAGNGWPILADEFFITRHADAFSDLYGGGGGIAESIVARKSSALSYGGAGGDGFYFHRAMQVRTTSAGRGGEAKCSLRGTGTATAVGGASGRLYTSEDREVNHATGGAASVETSGEGPFTACAIPGAGALVFDVSDIDRPAGTSTRTLRQATLGNWDDPWHPLYPGSAGRVSTGQAANRCEGRVNRGTPW